MLSWINWVWAILLGLGIVRVAIGLVGKIVASVRESLRASRYQHTSGRH